MPYEPPPYWERIYARVRSNPDLITLTRNIVFEYFNRSEEQTALRQLPSYTLSALEYLIGRAEIEESQDRYKFYGGDPEDPWIA